MIRPAVEILGTVALGLLCGIALTLHVHANHAAAAWVAAEISGLLDQLADFFDTVARA